MPFWIHGRDTATGRPRDSLFIETESEDDARQQAAEAGLTVEEVEHVRAMPPEEESEPVRAAPQEDAPKVPPTGPRRCVRCNSGRVVPRATIWDQGDTSGGTLQAYVEAKPDALFFRGAVYATLFARICADCGHAELFADGAEELYAAYRQSLAEAPRGAQ
jgi:hypothetical protein